MPRTYQIVAYDPFWPGLYQAEIARLGPILAAEVVAFHHIGSTAIPGIMAKPIIDILIEVRDIQTIDGYNRSLESIGYQAHGEYGISGRKFFTRDLEQDRTHHVHIYQTGHAEIKRQLDFRDYMLAHPDEGLAYTCLKETLFAKYPHDLPAYIAGKASFIEEIDRKAQRWSGQADPR